ncbi:MAG: hypothetical protein QOJ58_2022 [Alphaproteobacteria bacterium]|nr:hypothetical protein [Alphaproteobacteria bacterium]
MLRPMSKFVLPSCRVIPADLKIDPYPGPMRDGIDSVGIADEEEPSFLAGRDDCLVAVPNAHAEFVAAEVIPDILHRIEFRRVRRQRQESDVIRDAQSLAGLVPAGTVAYHDGVCAWGNQGADLLELFTHCFGIDGRHDNCRSELARVADCAEQVSRVMAVVAHHGRT